MPSRRSILSALPIAAVSGCLAAPRAASIPAVPDLPREATVVWAHEADAQPVGIEPLNDPYELPTEVTFVIRNETDERLSGNPYQWYLFKRSADTWRYLAPMGWPDVLTSLERGRAAGHKHVFRHERGIVDTEAYEPAPPSADEEYDPVRHPYHVTATSGLGGGQYALCLHLSIDEGVVHAVAFDVEAPAVDIGLDDRLAVNVDGETGFVQFPLPLNDPESVRIERTDAVEADRPIIAEQLTVLTFSPLEACLALMTEHPDLDRVYVRADQFRFISEGTTTFAFDGNHYRSERPVDPP